VTTARAVHIPADPTRPPTVVTVRLDVPQLNADTVGRGRYVELVHPLRLHPLQRRLDHGLVMLVDDAGMLDGLPLNRRASGLYGGTIAGDAWILGETDARTGPDRDLCDTPADLTLDLLQATFEAVTP
jgi:hypothetical protein